MTMRIGEAARRAGLSPELLRAWERRYGLLSPVRTEGGYRLYDPSDVERIRLMRELIDEGMSAAEAAQAVLHGPAPTAVAERPFPTELADTLERSLLALDATTAHDAIDALLGAVTIEAFLRDAVLPILHRIGDRWSAGEITIGHEHFVSNLVRGRLMGLARGWDRGGKVALLACAPGELHDMGLIAFGLALARRGWRIRYLGQNTPVESLSSLALGERADIVVVSSVAPERFAAAATELRPVGRHVSLAIGGAGATAEAAKRMYARLLPSDPIDAARQLSTS